MIVHEAVSMNDDAVTNIQIFQVAQESFSVVVECKYIPSFITPLDDVIASSWIFYF